MKRAKIRVLALCIAAGVATFATEVVVVWGTFGNNFAYYGKRPRSLEAMNVQKAFDHYVEQSGSDPNLLDGYFGGRAWIDRWGHLYQFTRDENRRVAYSLGRDNQPGGIGVDADFYGDLRPTASGDVTFAQFLFLPRARSWFVAAAVVAVCVSLSCWISARKHARGEATRQHVWKTAAIFSGLAVGAALLMAFLHAVGNHH
ncbi:MAG: hypothetical protein ACKVX7_09315 [Planctomycetota bacterium]